MLQIGVDNTPESLRVNRAQAERATRFLPACLA
jgi:hypothetical protein